MTLLAFGNGAPDVFSALSAVQNMKNNDVGLLLGALLGITVLLLEFYTIKLYCELYQLLVRIPGSLRVLWDLFDIVGMLSGRACH